MQPSLTLLKTPMSLPFAFTFWASQRGPQCHSLSAGYSAPSQGLILTPVVAVVAWGGAEVNFSLTPSQLCYIQ